MNLLAELRIRFDRALAPLAEDRADLLAMIRPAQNPQFGDYQANCAMPLGKLLGRPPRQIAQEIMDRLHCDDLCDAPEVAGPGFINLRLKEKLLVEALEAARRDLRLGVAPVVAPRRYVVDFSSPNVAKPMHVGHIRSTVIGDALCRILRFVGHEVISDNHLGDWGTQFGMIIYGFKHLVNRAAYEAEPVTELGRLYKLVNQIVDYHQQQRRLPELRTRLESLQRELAEMAAAATTVAAPEQHRQKDAKVRTKLEGQVAEAQLQLHAIREKIAAADADRQLAELVQRHPQIEQEVLAETAALHRGDPENLALWREFLPHCRADIQRIYDRLGIAFDFEYGESHYHDQLPDVVRSLEHCQLVRESAGAICVFLDGFAAPMIIQKRDGAYLYATTDLATIQFRAEQWKPDVILYVVDHRQGEHFEKLFAAARLWGFENIDFQHVRFGTVLGEDGRPFKTRSGEAVGLEALLDEAVRRAYRVVSDNDLERPLEEQLSEQTRREIAQVVGIAALKYADLSQHRASDYVFSYDKMLALNGNTATYMQYSYARVHGIFARGGVNVDALRQSAAQIRLTTTPERALAVRLLQFAEALDEVLEDYRPNQLTAYLYELAKCFSAFFEACPVLKADTDEVRESRLLLCDLTARTMRTGLQLLGIDVVEKM